MDFNTVIKEERSVLMQTYARYPVVLTHAKGVYVYDSNGKKYLDLVGGIACVPVGHCNPAVTRAITIQAKKIVHVSNLYYTEPQIKLAKKLTKISHMKSCFFCNSGTEANEAALKLAKKITKKTDFIVAKNAFHGRTHGSLSATWKKTYKDPFEPLLPGFTFVEYDDVQAIANAITSRTAAVMLEPIQGEAGVLIPKEGYLKNVAELCKKKNILLILDEVQTGNGRTGTFFAYQKEGIIPDIVTTAKGLANGLPIGVCLAKTEGFSKGEHGSTFGGNPLVCAAADAVVTLLLEKKRMKHALDLGNFLKEELTKLPNVKEVRGQGLMIGLDLTVESKPIAQACLAKGLLINAIEPYTLRLLPALTITKEQIRRAVQILSQVLSHAKQ